ncbi:MAG: 60S ribosomal protein L22 [Candidatus Bathyarchaeota archaeon]|nr:60S ribosomal protein L22 [Candidatus Bathyarchaeota archaeon]
MADIIVDASELKEEGKDTVQALVDFVKAKTAAEVVTDSNKVTVKGEVPKKHLRVLVKKFLHKQGLNDYFRVISDKENTLKIKERKLGEED